jgi:acyl-CoA synthetase (AMP-forming)/AMP-acid ligase II
VLPGRSVSHAEAETLSNRFAHGLLDLACGPGERLAVLLENSVESVLSVFGAEKAGLSYVALNARHAPSEQLAILRPRARPPLCSAPSLPR